MKKLSYSLLLCLLSCTIFTAKAQQPTPEENQKAYVEALDHLGASISLLNRYFVDSLNVRELSQYGLNAMLRNLDPYTEFYSKEDNEKLSLMTTGEYGGIGAIITQRPDSSVLINEPMKGMPADLAGLKAGDRIVSIDGKSYYRSTSQDVTKALKGKPDTKLSIVVERYQQAKPLTFTFERKKIHLPAVPYFGRTEQGFGYIGVSSFTESTYKEFRQALESLQAEGSLKGLVIDLRNNGGGLLREAVKLVSLFVPKGELVVETRAREELGVNNSLYTKDDPIALDLPLVVLVNGASASASEIVSGALQDLDRAVVVGQKTFGKGLVQTTMNLPHEAVLKFTTAKYYIPSGRCIQKVDYKTGRNGRKDESIPDSLAHTFFTKAGRPVKDSGGIKPDITVTLDEMPTMIASLMFDPMVFDWVTAYHYKHPKVAPAHSFSLDDSGYQEFGAYLKEQKFSYDKGSLKVLERLKAVAKLEGYYKTQKQLFDSLEKALEPNLSYDLKVHKREILEFLNTQLVERYYYREGVRAYSMKADKYVLKAEELLADPKQMQSLLGLSTADKTTKSKPKKKG